MRLNSTDQDITSGFISEVWRAIHKSIENNSKETFYVLKSFIRNILQISIEERSLKHFQQFINLIPSFYSISYQKKLYDNSLDRLHEICSSNASLHLQEIIWLDISIKSKTLNNLKDKKKNNHFYYYAFNAFSELLYRIVNNGDIKQFKEAIDNYDQISDMRQSQTYELRLEIRNLEFQNEDGSKDEQIKSLKEEYEVISKFEDYRRHVLIGIKYWVFFLFRMEKINEELAIEFIELIRVQNLDPEKVLDDILFFREGKFDQYMGWSEWDYKIRPMGKTYTPPMPYDWLTMGFMIDQIRKYQLYINLEDIKPKKLNLVRHLHENLKEYGNLFRQNFDEWKKILDVKSVEELEKRTEQILSRFAALKRKRVGYEEKQIAKAQLNKNKVEEFKSRVGLAWESQSHINSLFNIYQNTVHVTNPEIKLKQIGKRIFYKKGKMTFIEGDHSQTIHGLERLGSEIGQWENNEFFNTIVRGNHNKVIGSSVLKVLDEAITNIKNKKFEPDLILLPSDFRFKKRDLFESDLFMLDSNIENVENLYLGTYDKIPVYLSFSEFLKNRILISDFTKSFNMRFKTDSNWFKNKLNISVKEIDNEIAIKKLKEEPDAWKKNNDWIELSDVDAITLIKNSVIIEIWSTLDFQIKNKNAFVMAYLKH